MNKPKDSKKCKIELKMIKSTTHINIYDIVVDCINCGKEFKKKSICSIDKLLFKYPMCDNCAYVFRNEWGTTPQKNWFSTKMYKNGNTSGLTTFPHSFVLANVYEN